MMTAVQFDPARMLTMPELKLPTFGEELQQCPLLVRKSDLQMLENLRLPVLRWSDNQKRYVPGEAYVKRPALTLHKVFKPTAYGGLEAARYHSNSIYAKRAGEAETFGGAPGNYVYCPVEAALFSTFKAGGRAAEPSCTCHRTK
jgi:hypothetical protein